MLCIRKPSLRFYRHVLRATHSFPQDTLVVDDWPENVLAAMSLGMRGTSNTTNVSRAFGQSHWKPSQARVRVLATKCWTFSLYYAGWNDYRRELRRSVDFRCDTR